MIKPETWLDVMPAIPLAKGVPLTREVDGDREFDVCVGGSICGDPWETHEHPWHEENRVDLDELQGFGYVLWWAFAKVRQWVDSGWNVHGAMSVTVVLDELLTRHIKGAITDADRCILTKIIAELQS